MTTVLSIIIKIYGFLLRLYPKAFRSEFEEQMLLDFSDMAYDASLKGMRSFVIFCMKELIDLPLNLLKIYMKDHSMSEVLHSQPVNYGLRGGAAFGIVLALTVPISMFSAFALEKLFFWIDSSYAVAQDFEIIPWIPSALDYLLTGLALGGLLAVLFTDRSKYTRYTLVGMLGWCLYHAVSDILTSLRFWVFLSDNQLIYFDCTLLAFSGAILGLIFVVANSERRDAARWLTVGVVAYPLFVYLWVERLFALLPFRTPWRFVGLVVLMAILITSVFIFGKKLDKKRKLSPLIIAGTIGYPATRLIMFIIIKLIYPSIVTFNTTFDSSTILISNAIYGILFGLFLGSILGFQKISEPR